MHRRRLALAGQLPLPRRLDRKPNDGPAAGLATQAAALANRPGSDARRAPRGSRGSDDAGGYPLNHLEPHRTSSPLELGCRPGAERQHRPEGCRAGARVVVPKPEQRRLPALEVRSRPKDPGGHPSLPARSAPKIAIDGQALVLENGARSRDPASARDRPKLFERPQRQHPLRGAGPSSGPPVKGDPRTRWRTPNRDEGARHGTRRCGIGCPAATCTDGFAALPVLQAYSPSRSELPSPELDGRGPPGQRGFETVTHPRFRPGSIHRFLGDREPETSARSGHLRVQALVQPSARGHDSSLFPADAEKGALGPPRPGEARAPARGDPRAALQSQTGHSLLGTGPESRAGGDAPTLARDGQHAARPPGALGSHPP